MKKLLEKHQGWVALAISLTLFCLSPRIVNFFDPSDGGIVPGSYVQALICAVVLYFLIIGMAWQALQLDWKAFDRLLDKDKVSDWLNCISDPVTRIAVLFAPWVFLVWLFCFSLLAAIHLLR